MPRDYKHNCPCPHHPFECFGHPTSCPCANPNMSDEGFSEALRLIRKHMQPGDTVGKMFLRVAKVLEAEQFTQLGEVCDGCGKVLICRNCGKFRSGE
jgi:hypothetical protein